MKAIYKILISPLANIEQTVSRLDEEVKILKLKTNDTVEVVKVLKENMEFNEDDICDLKRDSKEVQHKVSELKKQPLYMENVIFWNARCNLHEAKEKGYTVFFSKTHPDKLFVNRRYIAPGESV